MPLNRDPKNISRTINDTLPVPVTKVGYDTVRYLTVPDLSLVSIVAPVGPAIKIGLATC